MLLCPRYLHLHLHLLPVPHTGNLGVPHLLLQLENTKHQRLGGWWASWNVDVDWNNSVATSCNTVAVVVVSSTVGAATHGDNPSWVWHLVVDLTKSWSHLVGESSGDDHDIGLTRRSTENDSHTILVVTWSRQVHHLDGAAGQTESEWPEGSLTSPVGNLVKSRPVIVSKYSMLFLR